MTEETRRQANELHSQIDNLAILIAILGDINSSCKSIQIRSDVIGTVTIEAGDYEPVLDYIIDELKQQKDDLEDQFRML